MRLIGLVPAGGSGARFGGTLPKQYARIDGLPVLAHTVARLLRGVPLARLYVAVGADDVHYAKVLAPFGEVVTVLTCGGPTRAETVRNALAGMDADAGEDDWIMVHDAARPCVPVDALRALVAALRTETVGALLAIPVADTLKRGSTGDVPRVQATQDRSDLWQAQTPQVFRYGILRAALARPDAGQATDEAQAVERLAATGACAMPRLVHGSSANLKITYPADLPLAAAILDMQGRTP